MVKEVAILKGVNREGIVRKLPTKNYVSIPSLCCKQYPARQSKLLKTIKMFNIDSM